MVPSEPMLKSSKVPLPKPSCKVLAVALGDAVCVISELPLASCKFQVRLRGTVAPSAKQLMVIPVTGALGVARVPLPLKVNAPLETTTGAPVAPRSGGGKGEWVGHAFCR